MKKFTTIGMAAILFLTAVFAAGFPGTAQAANGPVDVTVTVKNMTGGTVTLRLTNDTTHWFTFEGQGTYQVSVPEGHYSFYASTPCGSESGQMNLNVSKSLKFYCEDGLELSLTRPAAEASCNVYGWWHWYSGFGDGPEDGHWHNLDETPFDTEISSWEVRCTDGDPGFGSET